jgi:hypothetical protein
VSDSGSLGNTNRQARDAESLALRHCIDVLAGAVTAEPTGSMMRESVRGRATSLRAVALLGSLSDVESAGPWLLGQGERRRVRDAPAGHTAVEGDGASLTRTKSILEGPSRASLAGAVLRVAHRLLVSRGVTPETVSRVIEACGMSEATAGGLLSFEAGLGVSDSAESALQAAVRDAAQATCLDVVSEFPVPLCPHGESHLGGTFLRELVMRVDLALPGQKVAIEVDGPTHFVPPEDPLLWGAEPHNGPAIATADERALSVLMGPRGGGGAVSDAAPDAVADALVRSLAGRPRTPATVMRDAVLEASGWSVVSLELPAVLDALQAGGTAELASRVNLAVSEARERS